jgi:hypothetical protein
MTLERDEED